jgi:hypothetical protein
VRATAKGEAKIWKYRPNIEFACRAHDKDPAVRFWSVHRTAIKLVVKFSMFNNDLIPLPLCLL